mmetsp:Transcript_5684/g.11685  ORF Transcript_5684/g.11685 Transcript_5684/m.11685 type:complete len:740 (-) Transcript_5684:174-2393(-)
MKIWLKSIMRSNSPSADNHQDKQTPQVDKLANSNRRRSMSARPSRSRSNGDGVRRHKNHMAATAPDPEPELDSGDKPDPIPTIFRRANPFSRARSKSSSGRRPPSPPGHDGNRRACSRSSSRPRARSKSAPRGKSRATSYRSMNSAPMDGTMASSGGRSSERAEKRSSIPRSKSGGNFSNYRMDDDVARRRSFNSNNRKSAPDPPREDRESHHRQSSSSGKKRYHSCNATKQSYLDYLGLPRGLLKSFSRDLHKCDLRIWLIDNSTAMLERDSHRVSGSLDDIKKIDGVTRWEELSSTIAFHVDMATRCWIPTRSFLINYQKSSKTPQKFTLCCKTPDDIQSEIKQYKRFMKYATPKTPFNPLALSIQTIRKIIAPGAKRLIQEGKHINLVICTQGIPTDMEGNTGPSVTKEFKESIRSLSELPVKIIVRVVSDDENVFDFYNALDGQLDSLDVLDDFWGEGLEVYLRNPWLAYGLGLHRFREAGMAWELVNDIDERTLRIDEVYDFCKLFFLGSKNSTSLPDPRVNWDGFCHALSNVLQREKAQWNPVSNKLTPWIDLNKLAAMYGPKKPQPQPTPHSNTRSPSDHRRGQRQPPQSTHHQYRSQQHTRNPCTSQQSTSPPSSQPDDSSLPVDQQILRKWAKKPPDYDELHSLAHLLCTVPNTFPPNISVIEPHEYFDKWKPFSMDAFGDDDGQEDVVNRAVRKAKFFLHPDKLPKDLTDNQSTLFKTLWDVIHEKSGS